MTLLDHKPLDSLAQNILVMSLTQHHISHIYSRY